MKNIDKIRVRPAWAKSREKVWEEVFAPVVEGEVRENLTGLGENLTGLGDLLGLEGDCFVPRNDGNEEESCEEKNLNKVQNLVKVGSPVKVGSSVKVEARKPLRRRVLQSGVWRYAAAALVAAFLGTQFYTVTQEALRGEHLTVQLPDRSQVTLNAESKISYKPLAWWTARKVRLTGEAYFEVTKGGRFSVVSGSNTVRVLGTTFNVYARANAYRVTCLTGKVEVKTDSETFVLLPDMQMSDNLGLQKAPEGVAEWKDERFCFEKTPLGEVVEEVERQYNITVAADKDALNQLYTGMFSREERVEDILEIIGKPFGIKFEIAK